MKGTIYVTADCGRAMRKQPGDVRLSQVLDHAGAFSAGQSVHVVMRNTDGGQAVIAIAMPQLSALELAGHRSARTALAGDDICVLRGADITLMWVHGLK